MTNSRVNPWWWVLIAVLLTATGWFLFNLRAASRIPAPLGPDTTRLASPLAEDGYPDYASAIDAAASAGLEREDNLAIPLIEALGTELFRVTERQRARVLEDLGITGLEPPRLSFERPDPALVPAVADSDGGEGEATPAPRSPRARLLATATSRAPIPDAVNRWAREQGAVLDLLVAERLKQRWFLPTRFEDGRSPALDILGEGVALILEELGFALAIRARSHCNLEDLDAAERDLIALWELAALSTQIPGSVSWMVADRLSCMALRVQEELFSRARDDSERWRRIFAALDDRLPETRNVLKHAEEAERWLLLDFLLRVIGARPFDQPRATAEALRSGYDGALVLRESNALLDKAIGLLRAPTHAGRARLALYVEKLRAEMEEETGRYGTATGYLGSLFDSPDEKRTRASRSLARYLTIVVIAGLSEATRAETGFRARRQLARTGAVAALGRKPGLGWPADAEASLASECLDPFTDRPITVRRAGDALVLSSAGADLTPDDGREGSDDPVLILR